MTPADPPLPPIMEFSIIFFLFFLEHFPYPMTFLYELDIWLNWLLTSFCLVKVHGSPISEQRADSHSFIDLTFIQAISVTESFYKSLSYSELFSSLGGSLGLWLGVGIMQIIEHVANCGNIIQTFIRRSNKNSLI